MRTLTPSILAALLVALSPCWAGEQEDPCAVSPSGCNMGEEKIFKDMDSDFNKQQHEIEQQRIKEEDEEQEEEEEDQERRDNGEDDRKLRREEENRN